MTIAYDSHFGSLKVLFSLLLLLGISDRAILSGQSIKINTNKMQYCVGDTVVFQNNSIGGQNHYWSFTTGEDLFTKPLVGNIGNPGNLLSGNTYTSIVKEKDEYIVFANTYSNGNLVRFNFDSSLTTIKQSVSLGNFGGLFSFQHEGLGAASDGGKNYLFTVSSNKLVRLDFGSSFKNTPTATNLGNTYFLSWPHELQMFKYRDTWAAVICNRASSNQICFLKWVNGLENFPIAKTFTPVAGIQASSICLVMDDFSKEYYVFYSTVSNNGICRVKLGKDIFNPILSVTNFNNISGVAIARGIKIIKECNQYVGYLIAENGSLTRITFPGGLGGTPSMSNVTGLAVTLGKMEGISNFVIENDKYKALLSSPTTGLYSFAIRRNSIQSFVSTKNKTPLLMVVKNTGNIPVYYSLNHLTYGQTDTCFSLNVIQCCAKHMVVLKNDTFCKNDSGSLIASYLPYEKNLKYSWFQNGIYLKNGIDSFIHSRFPGEYKVVVSHFSCKDSAAARLDMDSIELPITRDSALCKGETFEYRIAGRPDCNYLLNGYTVSGTLILKSDSTKTWNITASNKCGVVNRSLKINFNDCDTCDFYFPNAFSPDDNFKNDFFKPTYLCNVKNIYFSIYNRWGAKIFETADISGGWDGNYMGKPAPDGIYIAIASVYAFKNNIPIHQNFKKSFHLIR